MQTGKVWASVECVVGLALLVIGLCAHFTIHAADPRFLALAPFGTGLLLSDALTRLAKLAMARVAQRWGRAR
jgi:hypothetical protein